MPILKVGPTMVGPTMIGQTILQSDGLVGLRPPLGGDPPHLQLKKTKPPQSPNPFHVEAAMVDHGPPDLQNRHSQSSARGLVF